MPLFSLKALGMLSQQALIGSLGNYHRALENRVATAGEVIIANAQDVQMGGMRTRLRFRVSGGRLVRRTKLPRGFKASMRARPGKLGILFGTLRRSITQTITRSGVRVRSEIGPRGVPYARIHELGGTIRTRRATIKMPARPYLQPAVRVTEKKVAEIIGSALYEINFDASGS